MTDSQADIGRRGSTEDTVVSRFLVIGRITKPHGVRGEVRVAPITDLPERFTWLDSVYVGESAPVKMPVEGARVHNSKVLLKLEGYDDRNAADTLRGALLQVPEDEGLPLEEGEYYLYQLEGLDVFSDSDEHLGSIVDILETKANNVFVVHGDRGEILLPDIEEVITTIDFDAGRMVVNLLPGLLPD